MQQFEYRVVPAPRRGEKARGLKTTPERFAYALTEVMNEMAVQGWEYLRADTLPCDERSGLTGKATTYQSLLVFRRLLNAAQPRVAEVPVAPVAAPVVAPVVSPVAPVVAPAVPAAAVVAAAQPAVVTPPAPPPAANAQPAVVMPLDPLAAAVRLGGIRSDAGKAPPVGPAKAGRDDAAS